MTLPGWLAVAGLLVLVAACRPAGPSPTADTTDAPTASPTDSLSALRYVALGDSYTIGTSVLEQERWPDQLVAALGPDDAPRLELVANLAVNGATSGDVIARQLPQLDALEPGFASLLVGVNDVVQGVAVDTYRANVARILDDLLARLPPDRILVVTTPDYTVTPQGAEYGDPPRQAAGIRANNEVIVGLARERSIASVDIYDLSLKAGNDGALVADDDLHPSGRQYALWVERIRPVVEELLGR